MSTSSCCLKGFEWEGKPAGREGKLAGLDTYITGDNPSAAILIIHDLFGWTFPNVRLLADHYAREADATVYVPDFLDGEEMPLDLMLADRWAEIDLAGILSRHSREVCEPQVFAAAKALRESHVGVAAAGFCYGGWAALRLGAREHEPPLVDCIVAAHPSLVVKADIDGVGVPTQVLAPEHDPVYTAELKTHTFHTLQASGVAFDYQHFPGVEHGCLVRGNKNKLNEREAMIRGKNVAVSWMRQFLYAV